MWLPTQKLSEPCPFGFLWRLHYIGIIDQTIGHWWSIILWPLPLPRSLKGWNWKFQPSYHRVDDWWQPAAIPRWPRGTPSHCISIIKDTFISVGKTQFIFLIIIYKIAPPRPVKLHSKPIKEVTESFSNCWNYEQGLDFLILNPISLC